jgi:protein-L-isoaspartate(D-aspartate) O-methyltransferase
MMTLEDCRLFYAQEVRWAANLSSTALVEAYARVPREKFLGLPPWQIGSPEERAMSVSGLGSMTYGTTDDPRDLYHNVVVALDAPQNINNGQPSALARWINALDLKAGDRAYHLGCGVGYYTAIIAEVVGGSGSVLGSLEPLLAKAFANGTLLKLKSVRIDAHAPQETCVVHTSGVCLSSAEPAATLQASTT